jgi:hypothetical protein
MTSITHITIIARKRAGYNNTRAIPIDFNKKSDIILCGYLSLKAYIYSSSGLISCYSNIKTKGEISNENHQT